jgi:hypothetical protein
MRTNKTASDVKAGSAKSATLSNAASTPESITKVFPPYLRYDVPAELAQIKANLQKSLETLHLENLAELAAQAQQGTLTAHTIPINIGSGHTGVKVESPGPAIKAESINLDAGTPISEFNQQVTGRSRAFINSEELVTPISSGAEMQGSPAPIIAELLPVSEVIISVILATLSKPRPTAKVAQTLTLNPVGAVQLGFWCKATFRARTGLKGYYKWSLLMSDGTKHDLNNGHYTKTRDIDFVLDGDTYSLSSYGGNGVAKFLVVCNAFDYYDNSDKGSEDSEGVILQFVNQPCIEIDSVSMNTEDCTGGDKNDWVTFTINLTAPAPPGGQAFHLSTDSDKASIHGGGTFYVAEGQKSETVSYFLATDKVAKDHVIKVIAKMNGYEQYANVKVKKWF